MCTVSCLFTFNKNIKTDTSTLVSYSFVTSHMVTDANLLSPEATMRLEQILGLQLHSSWNSRFQIPTAIANSARFTNEHVFLNNDSTGNIHYNEHLDDLFNSSFFLSRKSSAAAEHDLAWRNLLWLNWAQAHISDGWPTRADLQSHWKSLNFHTGLRMASSWPL